MFKKAFFTITDGIPMKQMEYYFNDKKTDRPVYRYQDGLGRFWMAHNRWGKGRVPSVNKSQARLL